jgi:hypothetical protein
MTYTQRKRLYPDKRNLCSTKAWKPEAAFDHFCFVVAKAVQQRSSTSVQQYISAQLTTVRQVYTHATL